MGQPAPMRQQQLWMDATALRAGRSRFSKDGEHGGGDYCPVSWKLERKLVLVPQTKTLEHLLHIGKEFVAVAPTYRRQLMSSPAHYMSGQGLPEEVPLRLPLKEALEMLQQADEGDETLEYKGYCPVTLFDGPALDPVTKLPLPIQDAIRKPSPDAPDAARALVVSYMGKKYRFVSEEKLERFMTTPWRFTSLQLPVKLPLQAPKISLAALPLVGYLEQTVVQQLTAALLELGRTAPRFPGRTGTESGLKYLALSLRARNPKNSKIDAQVHEKNLEAFTEACALLSRDGHGASLPTPLKPGDALVDRFFLLKDNGPKSTVSA